MQSTKKASFSQLPYVISQISDFQEYPSTSGETEPSAKKAKAAHSSEFLKAYEPANTFDVLQQPSRRHKSQVLTALDDEDENTDEFPLMDVDFAESESGSLSLNLILLLVTRVTWMSQAMVKTSWELSVTKKEICQLTP